MQTEILSTDRVLARTRAYIVENFLYTRPDMQLADDDRLLEKRIVDSMGMIELVTFLEDEFGVTLENDEITEENFATLGAIAQFVMGKSVRDAAP